MTKPSEGTVRPMVAVVDADEFVRDQILRVATTLSFEFIAFKTVSEFLAAFERQRTGCLVLDLELPDRSRLDFLRQLKSEDFETPVIAISTLADVPSAVSAMKLGAFDFLLKPLDHSVLLETIRQALDESLDRLGCRRRQEEMAEKLARLTPREREVFDHFMSGVAGKEIAVRLELSKKTVDVHRSRILRKLEAESLIALMHEYQAGRSR